MNKSVYTPIDIMKILGIGKNSAYTLCNSNSFPILRVGKKILISKVSFEKWMNGGAENDRQSAN